MARAYQGALAVVAIRADSTAERGSSRTVDDFGILRARHIEDVRALTPEAIARLAWSRQYPDPSDELSRRPRPGSARQ